jgi:hypothetical protein
MGEAGESKARPLWLAVAVDVLIVLPLGAWLWSRGWDLFGSTLVLVGVFGLVATAVQLWGQRGSKAVHAATETDGPDRVGSG